MQQSHGHGLPSPPFLSPPWGGWVMVDHPPLPGIQPSATHHPVRLSPPATVSPTTPKESNPEGLDAYWRNRLAPLPGHSSSPTLFSGMRQLFYSPTYHSPNEVVLAPRKARFILFDMHASLTRISGAK
ncbi:hypothetical protein CYLTODRAFT_204707 [Cylindrobasidium torrendii FP15055 ss-10]|uniref:Uncharacterized protein n=1 Tax=Cylindrobasidium torrendii FP15055 ss-10 TaxID=1314674 RepID=A0A0D7BIZ3_9AGAR|nr:hypothetical protein CYLTODRAFT_204707 [Cylindrobasidium torrendii FP15055 ss-10]